MEDVVNPAVPTTIGALLAEEWTINPLATLPSFLEMFMMGEAARSARKSLDTGLRLLQTRLEAQAIVRTPEQEGEATTNRSSLLTLLKKSPARLSFYLARFLKTFGPEVSCLILYLLERQCLRSEACATISESLYGGKQAKLERVHKQNGNGAASTTASNQRKLLPLSNRDKTRVALMVALGPYIRHRLLLWYQKFKQQPSEATSIGQSKMLQKFCKLFAWTYPLVHVSLCSMDLVYQWRYLLGRSVFFHPYSQYLGLVVRRVTQEDSQGTTSSSSSSSAAKSDDNTAEVSPEAASHPLRKTAVWALSSAVILSWISHFRSEYQRQRQEQIIITQQQQQQNSNNSQANDNNILANTIPPPPSSGIADYALPPHLCPLCRHPRVNPTASTSGFVFCYKCLLQHVKEHGKCPITGRECKEGQLLRLYEPNATNSAVPPPGGTGGENE